MEIHLFLIKNLLEKKKTWSIKNPLIKNDRLINSVPTIQLTSLFLWLFRIVFERKVSKCTKTLKKIIEIIWFFLLYWSAFFLYTLNFSLHGSCNNLMNIKLINDTVEWKENWRLQKRSIPIHSKTVFVALCTSALHTVHNTPIYFKSQHQGCATYVLNISRRKAHAGLFCGVFATYFAYNYRMCGSWDVQAMKWSHGLPRHFDLGGPVGVHQKSLSFSSTALI